VPFDTIVVCGAAHGDAPLLLEQALPLLTATRPVVRLLELPLQRAAPTATATRPLEPIAAVIGRLGLTLRRDTSVGTGRGVVQELLASGADLVIKGVALPEDGRATLDGLDLELIRRCPCPVWFVECTAPRPPRRIIAALRPAGD